VTVAVVNIKKFLDIIGVYNIMLLLLSFCWFQFPNIYFKSLPELENGNEVNKR